MLVTDMKCITTLLLLLCCMFLTGQQYNHPFAPAAGNGGVTWTDTFTRAANTDLTANCVAEGPNDDCGWIEVVGDFAISATNDLDFPNNASLLESDTDTDTLSQYSGATWIDTNGTGGAVIRGDGTGGATECYYTFRMNFTNEFNLRACDSGNSCATLETFTDGGGDFTDMTNNDSIGISSDGGTLDGIELHVYKFDSADVPASFGNWEGSATNEYSVCASGCDKTWTTAPSSKCSAGEDQAKRVGMYSGSTGTSAWDTWRGGDI
jgi:hypothetical protein